MWTRDSLVEHLTAGNTVDFLLFWGHTPKAHGVTDAACLSQWFPARFRVDGVDYKTAEHFMMAEKARLFDDDEALAKILAAPTPGNAKAHGRTVEGFSEEIWEKTALEAIVRGNVAKFGQNPDLAAFLQGTGEQVLVEAAPADVIWGIGMAATDPDARTPAKWKGKNLLGFALMEARTQLRT